MTKHPIEIVLVLRKEKTNNILDANLIQKRK